MINSYSEFQPLKEVVVGRGYPPDYFDCVTDHETRTTLQHIFREIEEDFEFLVKTLEDFGVVVTRPALIGKLEFELSVRQNRPVLPPITPRDRQSVYGNKLVRFSDWPTFAPMINYYHKKFPDQVILPKGLDLVRMTEANASCIFKLGRDIWFDESNWLTADHTEWLKQHILTDPNYRFHHMTTNGHSDCVFSVLKPGVILTCFHDAGVAYQDDFAGWELYRVDRPSIERFTQFRDELHPGQNWWVPGKDNLLQFRSYVDQYLNHWVGEIHETVFDVNCLSVDTKHVIFACYNKEVFDYCESHGITPVLCELRHRFFFDGGTHCCTLDIHREGGMEDYF
jgi:hypothetical protein